MFRHLISDVHEWRNEISTVPVFTIAILHSRERACNPQRGKKTLLCLTLVYFIGEVCLSSRIDGSLTYLKYHCLV